VLVGPTWHPFTKVIAEPRWAKLFGSSTRSVPRSPQSLMLPGTMSTPKSEKLLFWCRGSSVLGYDNDEIASRLDTRREIVSKWRKRFFERGLPGLDERPRGGRPPVFPP
jgi:hypothetical protein